MMIAERMEDVKPKRRTKTVLIKTRRADSDLPQLKEMADQRSNHSAQEGGAPQFVSRFVF
jgi:hypothetical protein